MTDRKAANLTEDYLAAGFGNKLGFGRKPALVMVDFAKAYVDPGSPLYAGIEDVVEVAADLLASARAARIPIFFTRVEYQPGGADGGYFYRKIKALQCFDRGNPLGDYIDGLAPEAGETEIVKQYPSAFFGTPLAEMLKEQDCDTVLVAGLTTSGCVRATVLDALQHGFIPVLVADACGDRDQRVQRANLFDVGNKYADIVSVAEVEAYLVQLGA